MTAGASIPAGTAEAVANPARPRAQPFYIASLDGVRALSFLTVFLAHAGLDRIVPGYFGLSVFFFLSGYLITTLLRLEFDRDNDVNLKQFYLRRVFRILPPFYLVLFISTLLAALGAWEASLSVEGIAYQVLHLTNYYIIGHGWWHGMAPGTWVYWSLAIEEHFYLAFPLLYLVLRRHVPSPNRQALILVALCALVLLWRCVLVFGFDAPKDRMYVGTDTRVDSILAGCLLGIWRNPALGGWGKERERSLAFFWLPLGLALVFVSLVVRQPAFDQTFRYTLQSFGLLPLFVAAVHWSDRGVFRLLNLRPVRYLGVLSYSMYLMHTTALWGIEHRTTWSAPVRGLFAFVLLVALGALIHRWVELPSGTLRRRLSGGKGH